MKNRISVWTVVVSIVGAVILGVASFAWGLTCIEGGSVKIAWTYDNPPADFAGCRIYRSITGVDGPWELISGSTLVTGLTYTDTNLPPGDHPLHYKTETRDECGNGGAFSEPSTPDVRHDTIAPGPTGTPTVSVVP